jgi:putative tricarboxylic transport membrane protein
LEEFNLNRGEVISGVVLGVLGIYIVTEAARWEYLGPDGPGPGFFPIWYGIAMIVLAAVLVLQNFMAKGAVADGKPVNWRETGRVFIAWAGFVASVLLLKVLGFILSFGFFVLFIVGGLYRRPWRVAISVAVGCAAGFYLVFPLALNVRLPTGILGF